MELLEKDDYMRIYEMYRDMLYSFEESRLLVAESFFNTLYNSGYLSNIREQKIENILNGVDTIDTWLFG